MNISLNDANILTIDNLQIQLTPQQVAAIKKQQEHDALFNKKFNQGYWYINEAGQVRLDVDKQLIIDVSRYNAANYCTDKSIMEQRALHELLNRRLWRFAVEHGELDNKWNKDDLHWIITYHTTTKNYYPTWHTPIKEIGAIHFSSSEIANKAIKEIIEPFIAEHPEYIPEQE